MTGQWWRAALWSGGIAAMAVGGQSLVSGQQPPAVRVPAHVVMTSQQDRQRMMDQLKITLFPSGPGAYLASTYDENTANPYPSLPDPLKFNGGATARPTSPSRQDRRTLRS